jgi:hypothetical protein
MAPVGCASPLIIDDMEDGDAWMCASPSRQGDWFTTHQGGNTVPATGHGVLPTLIPMNRESSRFAVHFSGSGFSGAPEEVAIVGIDVRARPGNGPYDASSHGGITFFARASESLAMRVKFASAEPMYGVTCVPTGTLPCNDHYRKMVTFGTDWQPYTVSFSLASDLAQETWGVAVAKDLAHLLAITFDYSSVSNPRSFDLWIDDLEFY